MHWLTLPIFLFKPHYIKIKRMKNLLYPFLLALSIVAVSSCGGPQKSPEEKAEEKKELSTFVEREFEYPIPTSFEVTDLLQKANANFVFNVTNPPENVDKYVAEWQKAMNLGVYGADLSYASTYNKQEETLQFLNASRQLVDELNITSAFNEDMLAKLEDNLDNKDEMILIITESIYNTYNHLNSSGDELNSLLVIAGSVVEGLYITGQLIISSDYNEGLMEVLAAQKSQVNKLVALMEEYAEDENVNRVLPKLRFINLFDDQVGDDGTITEDQFNDVITSINEMRESIVN